MLPGPLDRKWFARGGYAVDRLSTALRAMGFGIHMTVPCDVPNKTGFQVVETLAATTPRRPFFPPRDTVEDRVKGLNLGADDYLIKPFAFDGFWPDPGDHPPRAQSRFKSIIVSDLVDTSAKTVTLRRGLRSAP
jgi:hypothetical protein